MKWLLWPDMPAYSPSSQRIPLHEIRWFSRAFGCYTPPKNIYRTAFCLAWSVLVRKWIRRVISALKLLLAAWFKRLIDSWAGKELGRKYTKILFWFGHWTGLKYAVLWGYCLNQMMPRDPLSTPYISVQFRSWNGVEWEFDAVFLPWSVKKAGVWMKSKPPQRRTFSSKILCEYRGRFWGVYTAVIHVSFTTVFGGGPSKDGSAAEYCISVV